jgi:hypothetical protein
VKWRRDLTGRFAYRPHFDPDEIESECLSATEAFHQQKYSHPFCPPWKTEDLGCLIEQYAESLDLYADLHGPEGKDVEGLTWFRRGRRPAVEIERTLTENARFENRLRTTLTHECTHVILHGPLWQLHWNRTDGTGLFDGEPREEELKSVTYRAPRGAAIDWMEWQANRGCGAILMPKHLVLRSTEFFRTHVGSPPTIYDDDTQAEDLAEALAAEFQTSRRAASVRLAVLRVVRPASQRGQGEFEFTNP